MSSPSFGRLLLVDGRWAMDAQPHVIQRAKRIFPRANQGIRGRILIRNTPEVCTDLEWMMTRWRLDISPDDEFVLQAGAKQHQATLDVVQAIIAGQSPHTELIEAARPARKYQLDEVEMLLQTGRNLVVHSAGLGKTATALYPLGHPACRPGLFVTLTHLPEQVVEQLELTYPEMHAHILKGGDVYDPEKRDGVMPDLIVTSYSKLAKWSDWLAGRISYVNFDEVQELRHDGSAKYLGAQHIALDAQYVMGTTATPIYGYGGEMHNLIQILAPGFLGSRDEFVREWAGTYYGSTNISLGEATALGTYLRTEGVMSVKTRKDVGREIEQPIVMVEKVVCEERVIQRAERSVLDIAGTYLAGGQKGIERMQMASQLDMKLREATGIGKAHSVADFVNLLLESEERILLFGWHRMVYDIWTARLAHHRPVMFTGSESPKQKNEARVKFAVPIERGGSRVMMMSLRAGAGIDGLQKDCSCVVFGELDWSPQVHAQNIWRVDRDGQESSVAVYYCISDGGTDPLMEDVLGLKSQQSGQIVDPDAELFATTRTDEGRMTRLAEQIVSRHGAAGQASQG